MSKGGDGTDPEHIKATFEQGVLEIAPPKVKKLSGKRSG
jgi:HSP20 family molecular chaperone IbpA